MAYHTTVRVYKHVVSECVHVRELCVHLPGERTARTSPSDRALLPVAPVPTPGQLERPRSCHALLSSGGGPGSHVMHEARGEHTKLFAERGPWKPPLAEEACDGTQAEGQAARGWCLSAHAKARLPTAGGRGARGFGHNPL